MKPLEFLRSPQAMRLLERAARSAGMPLSIHYVGDGQEGPRVMGWGACETCKYVVELEGGRKACRESRSRVSGAALEQRRALPFICHMGFANIAAPLLEGEGFAVTFGPYVPAEEARSLEYDVLEGLSALLDEQVDELPVPLDDVHHAPAASVPAMVEWVLESLNDLWRDQRDASPQPAMNPSTSITPMPPITPIDPAPVTPPRPRRFTQAVHVAPHAAADLAAAVMAGRRPQIRRLLRSVLDETEDGARPKLHVRRARVVAAVSAAMQQLEQGGLTPKAVWAAYPGFLKATEATEDDKGLLDAAVRLLAKGAPELPKTSTTMLAYRELNELLLGNLADGITLNEVAAKLGQPASTITHRLIRNFGMNFSEYAGRLRIDKAKKMLRSTRLTATQIAERVGVADQSHFSKLFRKFEGLSPSEYRERFGKKMRRNVRKKHA